ncbi:MAG: putative secreted protein [Myxococcaceae bacterium]|nr:putative secreted protein [Myxococcaceae bacterium]
MSPCGDGMERWFARTLWLLALLSASACTNTSMGTEVLVVVDSALRVGEQLTSLHVAVYAPDVTETTPKGARDFVLATTPLMGGGYTLPLSFALLPERGKPPAPFRIVVTGRGPLGLGGAEIDIVEQQAIASFQPGSALRLDLFLSQGCLRQLCRSASDPPSATTCLISTSTCAAVPVFSPVDLPKADTHDPVGGYTVHDRPEAQMLGDGGATDADLVAKDAHAPEEVQRAVDAQAETDAAPDATTRTADAAESDAGVCPADSPRVGSGCSVSDHCVGNGCQHGSVCRDAAASYTCDCTGTGYQGAFCEAEIQECSGAHTCNSADYPCAETAGPGYTCRGQLADWQMPDALPGAKVAPNYDVTTDPTVVLDNVTKLRWQRTPPATYAGCTGAQSTPGDSCKWAEAVSYCLALSLGGRDDWRLPTKIELESIVDETHYNPNIDSIAFPGTASNWFWSASPNVATSGTAWLVSFAFGADGTFPITDEHLVRCVSAPPAAAAGTPAERYVVDLALETVTDRRTGLIWQRLTQPGTQTWDKAKTQCSANFRLPTYKELLTLVDPTRKRPAINPSFRGVTAAEDTPAELYWSISPYLGSTGFAWDVDFDSGGNSGNGSVSNADHVRCVR